MKSKNAREQTEVQNPGQEKDDQTVKSPSQRFLLQVLTEEMELIGRAITERNQQSTQIKQWCLTLWMATWGIVSIEYVMKWFQGHHFLVLCAPAVFPPIFLGLDLINKRIERKFTFRARQMYRFLNASGSGRDSGGSSLESFLESGDLGDFRVYDPAAMNWYDERDQENVDSRTELEQWISIRSVFSESWGLGRWCRKVGGKLENWPKLLIVKHSERRCAAAERSLRHGTSYSIGVPDSIFR